MRDDSYKDFNSKLIPNISNNLFIGVRTPDLRKLAKKIIKLNIDDYFISELPHKYFEENQLHAFILSNIPEFDLAIEKIDKFLPYVNNWATCDQMSPKSFTKNTNKLIPFINKWIKSNNPFTVRFGILNLMRYFLDDKFDTKYSNIVAKIKSDEYYVNMMRAWYFATALAKQYDNILPYFKNKKLDTWTHNHAITKACESLRIPEIHKKTLKALKIKNF